MFQWLSLTRMSVAPAASAPSIAAFVSPTIRSTAPGSAVVGSVGSG
jgi:hypothetical protein